LHLKVDLYNVTYYCLEWSSSASNYTSEPPSYEGKCVLQRTNRL